jgi:hypothetical protein
MDVNTIDTQYQQLQSKAQTTVGELRTLAGKLQTAVQAGNQDARDWLLDLKSVTLSIQAEQNQVALLLQALHDLIANQPSPPVQQVQPSPWEGPRVRPWRRAVARPCSPLQAAGLETHHERSLA